MVPKVLMWSYLLPLLVGLLLASGACGDGGGGSGGGDVRDQLSRMVLGLEDLPEGYSEEPGDFSTNQDVALGDQEKLSRLQDQGRILGYDVVFTRGDVSEVEAPFVGVDSAVSLYETDSGASASYAEAVEEARRTDWEALLGFGDTKVEELEQSIAEETVWIRVTGLVLLGEEETPILVIDDQVLMRQGRTRSFLRVFSAIEGSSDRGALVKEIALLAERQVDRIGDVLSD